MQNRIYAADNEKSKSGYLAGIVAAMLLTVGITGVFAAFTHDIICSVFILLEAVVLSAVTAMLGKKPTALAVFRAVLIIVFAMWVMLDFTGIRRAIINSANVGIEYANAAFSKDFAQLGIEAASSGDFIALFSILTAVITMLVNYLVSKRSAVWLTIFTFIILIAALTLRINGAFMILPLMVIGWAGCWSRCSGGDAKSVLYISAGMAAVFIMGAAVLMFTGFDGFGGLDDLHEDTAKFIYKTRFGGDALPKGDLFEADTMLEGNDETIIVTFEKPEALYLKGFTGGSFGENKWIEYEEGTYLGEWSGMLDYFKVNDFDPNSMYFEYKNADDSGVESNTVTVENTGADRSFVYLPFTVSEIDGGGAYAYRDLYVKSNKLFGAKEYGFKNISIDEKPEQLSAQAWVNGSDEQDRAEFLKKENVYRAFVRDTYLEIDEKTKNEIDEVFYKDFESDEVGIYTITTRIRSILKLITSYTENPMEPQDRDFIGWFLADYKRGNSAYYATAATMAYRAAGIPARYAEGYLVSDADVENLNMTQKNSIVLSNKNAHAWVEIYRDGMGWVSVEVTPGYYVEEPDTDEVIEISESLDISGNGNGGGEQYTGDMSMYSPEKASRPEDRMNSGLRILLILICLLTILMMIMYIRYLILVYLKNERIYGVAKVDTANYMLMYICAALAADGIEANPDNTTAIRRELLKKYDAFKPQEFDRVNALVSRSSYGGASLREHELRTIRIFIEKLSNEVYKGKPLWKKIILRYVKIV